MSDPYEEIIEGESYLRFPPGGRHERVCAWLQSQMAASLTESPSRLLQPRSVVQLSPGTIVRPDLAVVAAATGKAWLAVEIIDPEDHRTDTVTKKGVYEDANFPRLWMIDPRYDNVEVYHGSPHGLKLVNILANRDMLTEKLIPKLSIAVRELFQAASEK